MGNHLTSSVQSALLAVLLLAPPVVAQVPMQIDVERIERQNSPALRGWLAEQQRHKDAMTEIAPPLAEPPPVEGIVLRVRKQFAEISLGSDDGLAVGHTLEFRRGAAWLGRAIARRVDPDRAVVEREPGFWTPEIRAGDRVLTGPAARKLLKAVDANGSAFFD
jgi:hypothetical protein